MFCVFFTVFRVDTKKSLWSVGPVTLLLCQYKVVSLQLNFLSFHQLPTKVETFFRSWRNLIEVNCNSLIHDKAHLIIHRLMITQQREWRLLHNDQICWWAVFKGQLPAPGLSRRYSPTFLFLWPSDRLSTHTLLYNFIGFKVRYFYSSYQTVTIEKI